MYQRSSDLETKLDKAMKPEQFNQVVEAILSGKYSWACVLILRFAGYNPLHYIPYRTYNRLIKEHCQRGQSHKAQSKQKPTNKKPLTTTANYASSTTGSQKIEDLSHVELVSSQKQKIQGGTRWLYGTIYSELFL